jgi:hypothetical protein
MGSCGESAHQPWALGTEGRDPGDVLGESQGGTVPYKAIFPGDIP